jgi:hypothetical protein
MENKNKIGKYYAFLGCVKLRTGALLFNMSPPPCLLLALVYSGHGVGCHTHPIT